MNFLEGLPLFPFLLQRKKSLLFIPEPSSCKYVIRLVVREQIAREDVQGVLEVAETR